MLIKNQKGIALLSVLIFITVASLLGTTVWYASSQDTLHSKIDENDTQAYYFARSGVEMAIGLIKNGYCNDMAPNEKMSFYGALDGAFSKEETDNYNIKFEIELDNNDNFIIESIGIVRDGVAGAAQAQNGLKFMIPWGDIEGSTGGDGGTGGGGGDILLALFSKESIDLNGSAGIIGNVATNSVAPNSVNFAYSCYINNGNLYIGPGADWQEVVKFNGWGRGPDTNIPDGEIINLPSVRNYPLPIFPEFPDGLDEWGDLKTDWKSGEYYEISDNDINEEGYYKFGKYNLIKIYGNRTVVIKLGGSDRIIRVKKLDIQQGNIVLEGNGRLLLYVEETFDINGSSKVNFGGDNNSLNMFFKGNQSLDFKGSTRFVGNIFAQKANSSISGSNNIDGNIITGGTGVSVTGAADANPMIIYAPNADLSVSGSGKIQGTAVVKECTLNGASQITASSSLDTTFLNSLIWGPEGPPSLFLNSQEPSQEPSNSTWRDKGKWIKI